MAKFSTMKVLDVWYSKFDIDKFVASAPDAEAKQNRERIAKEARANVADYVFPKITKVHEWKATHCRPDSLLCITPLLKKKFLKACHGCLLEYRETLPYERRVLLDRYHMEDIALQGCRCRECRDPVWCGALNGREDDPLLLQVKEARPSVLAPYAGKSEFDHQGERIVVGQRLMQSASDMLLGWTTEGKENHIFICGSSDMKFSLDISILTPLQMSRYAEVCGWTLARAHARPVMLQSSPDIWENPTPLNGQSGPLREAVC